MCEPVSSTSILKRYNIWKTISDDVEIIVLVLIGLEG